MNLYIIIPSQNHMWKPNGTPLNESNLKNIDFEERLLYHLWKLKNPKNRIFFISSKPIDFDILKYYLDFIPDLPTDYATRLTMTTPNEPNLGGSLAKQILQDVDIIQQLYQACREAETVYFKAFQFTEVEKALHEALGLSASKYPWEDNKAKGREVFLDCNLSLPIATPLIETEEELLAAITTISDDKNKKWFLKANEGSGNRGNAVWQIGEIIPDNVKGETGFLAEEFIDGHYKTSPSVRAEIKNGKIIVLDTWDQQFKGSILMGGTCPANALYRNYLEDAAQRVGRNLIKYNVEGPYSVGFIGVSDDEKKWNLYAVDLNVREGGASWSLHWKKKLFSDKRHEKCLRYSNHLKRPNNCDFHTLIKITHNAGTSFNPKSGEGTLLHLLSSTHYYGMTCFASTIQQAESIFKNTHKSIKKYAGFELFSDFNFIKEVSLLNNSNGDKDSFLPDLSNETERKSINAKTLDQLGFFNRIKHESTICDAAHLPLET